MKPLAAMPNTCLFCVDLNLSVILAVSVAPILVGGALWNYSENPLIQSSIGHKNLAVLTGFFE